MEFKKDYKKLCSAYNKRLRNTQRNKVLSLENTLDYFVTYLKFIRDYFILTEPPINDKGEENYKITTIAAAISEYQQYIASCNTIEYINGQAINSETEASLNKYTIEKQFH